METQSAWKKYEAADIAELERICADYIEFIYSRTGAPGYHYKAVGFKYTGWTEDEGY